MTEVVRWKRENLRDENNQTSSTVECEGPFRIFLLFALVCVFLGIPLYSPQLEIRNLGVALSVLLLFSVFIYKTMK